MIALRDDQLTAVTELRSALRMHQSTLLCAAPGWGKTVASAYMALGVQQRRKRVIFAVHRRALAYQTAVTFKRFGIDFGFIASGMRANPFASVQIASAQSLKTRRHHLKCDLMVPDEAHLWGADSMADQINEAKSYGAHIVPLTGTPERGNGGGLGHIADHIIYGPSVEWLIDQGFLARYRAFAPAEPDLSSLHVRGGEYVEADVDALISKPVIYGDRVTAYRRFAAGKRMIGYCHSRKNGAETEAVFNASGIRAVFVDGETPDDEMKAAIEGFADRRIEVLLNCALFREGFDLSAQVGRNVPIEAVGLWTPTLSRPLAVQMMMRPMRPQPEPAVLLDHVNTFKTHGFPDDEREYSLDGRKRLKAGEATIPTTTCKACLGTFRPHEARDRKCPLCEAELPAVEGRKVEEIDAEMAEIDLAVARAAKKQAVRSARDLPSLAAVAVANGYKPGWVLATMKARGETLPSWSQVEAAIRGVRT